MDIFLRFSRNVNEPAPIAPFRFFDLPAELRIKVYEDLLTIRPTKDCPVHISRHSQILRASRKCHSEGQPILERLNALTIEVSAFALLDGSPRDLNFPTVFLRFAGGVQKTLMDAVQDLPISDGTCYDVNQRWQHAIRTGGGGGGRMRVLLQLSYHSITCDRAERLAVALLALERQGVPHDSICRMGLKRFRTTTETVAAGRMSIAEAFQLAFALEHLAPTPPYLPLRFVSAGSGEYDRMMDRNHAHELMTASTKHDAVFIRRLWALMAEWLPASVANYATRFLLPRHACGWDFRRDLCLVERTLSRLKGPKHWQRSSNLPYTGPPVVCGILPSVEKFLQEEHARHRQQGMRTAVEKS